MDIIMPVIIITTNISIKVNPFFNFFIIFRYHKNLILEELIMKRL
jgi:hypothetical protein